jgi:DNA end-binding protein Ku
LEARITPKEIDLAKRLIDDMTEKWDPAALKDTYYEDLMKRIQEKIKKGQTREITKPSGDDGDAPATSNIIDLSALLKRSIDSGTRKSNLRLVPEAKNALKRKKA